RADRRGASQSRRELCAPNTGDEKNDGCVYPGPRRGIRPGLGRETFFLIKVQILRNRFALATHIPDESKILYSSNVYGGSHPDRSPQPRGHFLAKIPSAGAFGARRLWLCLSSAQSVHGARSGAQGA